MFEDLLWSDPVAEMRGRKENPRGAGIMFGADVSARFLMANNLKLIIRSHECMQKGYAMHHHDMVITVFSASNYCSTMNNEGAFIMLERDLIPKIVPYFAKPKERLTRYRMRHAVMENDIIAKLLQRIPENRLALTDWYRSWRTPTRRPSRRPMRDGLHTQQTTVGGGSEEVLKLNIPFMEFQDYLGLPKLGVDGRRRAPWIPPFSGALPTREHAAEAERTRLGERQRACAPRRQRASTCWWSCSARTEWSWRASSGTSM